MGGVRRRSCTRSVGGPPRRGSFRRRGDPARTRPPGPRRPAWRVGRPPGAAHCDPNHGWLASRRRQAVLLWIHPVGPRIGDGLYRGRTAAVPRRRRSSGADSWLLGTAGHARHEKRNHALRQLGVGPQRARSVDRTGTWTGPDSGSGAAGSRRAGGEVLARSWPIWSDSSITVSSMTSERLWTRLSPYSAKPLR